jgi:DNA-directed RNA polymerase specialized sigma24 family protein
MSTLGLSRDDPALAEAARRNPGGPDTHRELAHLRAEDWDRADAESTVPPFEQLYEEQFDFTFRVLRYLGVPLLAVEDAVQDVWLAVHRQLPQFEGRSSFRTWLFSIALNIARNQRRQQRRAPKTSPVS